MSCKTLLFALTAGLAAFACSGEDPSNEDNTPIDTTDGGGSSSSSSGDGGVPLTACADLTIRANPVSVLRGATTTLRLVVTGHTKDDHVEVSIEGTPSGATISAPTVAPGDINAIEVPVQAGEAAPGVRELKLSATCTNAPGSTALTTARLVIRGAPGELDTSYGINGVAEAPEHTALMDVEADGDALMAVGVQYTDIADYYGGVPIVARLREDGRVDSTFNGGQGVLKIAKPLLVASVPYFGWDPADGILARGVDGAWMLGLSCWLDSEYSESVVLSRFTSTGVTTPLTPADRLPGRHHIFPVNDGYLRINSDLASVYFERRTLDHQEIPNWPEFDLTFSEGASPNSIQFQGISVGPENIMLLVADIYNRSYPSVYILLDPRTGTVIKEQMFNVTEDTSVSRPAANGERVITNGGQFSRVNAQGEITSEGYFVTSDMPSLRTWTGNLGDRVSILFYSNERARLAIIGPANTLENSPNGFDLQGLQLNEHERLLELVPVSENRVLAVIGGYEERTSTSWRIRRYWL